VTEASSGVDASISIGVSIGMPLSASLRSSALVVGIFGAIEIGVENQRGVGRKINIDGVEDDYGGQYRIY
jgi:hypothetical protein